MRVILLAALLALGSAVVSTSAAQPTTATVDQFVTGILALSKEKCLNRGQGAARFEQDGKLMEARSIRIGEATLCDCVPARLRALRGQLKPKELSQRVTQEEFMKNYAP